MAKTIRESIADLEESLYKSQVALAAARERISILEGSLAAIDLLAQRVNRFESQVELLVKMIAEMSKHG
ncbi:hypothetical protein [Paraburkholderia bannensis]|uniref:hypothetical protein n=1 Tax=Paraburkholderia bannensis TaxID=765414 RepID=UPI0005AB3114|nr:hypothetical protein [Paraburkholderia bannensis]